MRIDRDLKLVLTLDTDNGPAYCYCPPLAAAVFDTYYDILTKAYSEMAEKGGRWMILMGPRHAARVLKDVALREETWTSRPANPATGAQAYVGLDVGFVAETRRTAYVALPTEQGWENIPLETAATQKRLTEEDISEIEQALTFFTVVYASMGRKASEPMLTQVFGTFGAELTSLNATDWAASLPTSTPAAAIGAKAAASSTVR